MPPVQIKRLRHLEDFRACERIQEAVWGEAGVGVEAIMVVQKYGGVVLGASVDGRVVGFLFAFLARRHGQLIHWSHLMAVEERYRDLRLGFRMKLFHRKLALAEGIKSICWTYDPLQSRNATLNLARLGAQVEEYVPNCYGRFASRIEKNLPSDRFVVNWRIATARVTRHLRIGTSASRGPLPSRVNETTFTPQGFLQNRRIFLGLRHTRLAVEIPGHTDDMRARALELATRWRIETRKIFQHYLPTGYRVADFLPPSRESQDRCFYILQKGIPATG